MIGITLLLLKLAKTIGRSHTLEEDYSVEVAAPVSSGTFSQVRSINNFRCLPLSDYMAHQYGSSESWDKIAETTGDSGWSWGNMKRYVSEVSTASKITP